MLRVSVSSFGPRLCGFQVLGLVDYRVLVQRLALPVSMRYGDVRDAHIHNFAGGACKIASRGCAG